MLDLKNIRKTFNAKTVNEKVALNGLNLHLNDSDFVTVIGGNGAGKSTMLNAIAGVWPIDQGSIVIDGVDISRLPEHRRAPLLGRVFQDPMTGTAATMQIEENLALAARRGERRTLKAGISRVERNQYRDQLAALGLGLEDRMTAKVGLLSGGQRQALTLLGPATGADAAHGDAEKAKAFAPGRAHRCPGPPHRREGFAAFRKNRNRK